MASETSSSSCWRGSQGTIRRITSLEYLPSIVLPADNSGECSISNAKRQRRGRDGSYSPCPSSNGSPPHSPSSGSEENPTSRAQYPTPSSLQPSQLMMIDSGSPELVGEAENCGSILNGLMADLSIVFSNRALKGVDQELCFGMVCLINLTFHTHDSNFFILEGQE